MNYKKRIAGFLAVLIFVGGGTPCKIIELQESSKAEEATSMANKAMTVMQQGSEEFLINDPNIANEFSTDTNYTEGMYVNYQGSLYRFRTNHPAGSWNSSHVELVKVGQDVYGLKSTFNDYTKNVIGQQDYFLYKGWTENAYINSSGEIVEQANFHYSDAVAVGDGDYYFHIVSTIGATTIRIVGYDDGSFEEVVTTIASAVGKNTYKVSISGVDSIRVSCSSQVDILSITKYEDDIMTMINEKANSVYVVDIDFSDSSAGWIDSDGSINISGNWKHTNAISAKKGDIFNISVYGYSGNPVILKLTNTLTAVVVASQSGLSDFTYTLDEDAEIIINFTTSFTRTGTITKTIDLFSLQKSVDNLDKEIKIPFLTMLHKIGVIGDSLSSGEIWDGSEVRDCYNYSWLSNIARDIGADCVHYSRGGMTAKEWWSDGGGYKTALANEETKPSAYYIALGTNDKNQQEYPIGNITDSAGADSFVGYMRSIIEYVHTQQPNAAVFLVTTYNTSVASTPYNEMIEDISDLYSYCFFINYAENAPVMTTQSDVYVENSHFTSVGYVLVSDEIKKLTEQAITENLTWFKHFGLSNYDV